MTEIDKLKILIEILDRPILSTIQEHLVEEVKDKVWPERDEELERKYQDGIIEGHHEGYAEGYEDKENE